MTITNPYGFIYITTNLIDGKRYIGQKKFDNYWKGYLGSGKHLREAIKKYGRENFSRNIVAIAYSKEELDDAEISIIKFLGADKSRDYYNIAEGGCVKGRAGEDAFWYNEKKVWSLLFQILEARIEDSVGYMIKLKLHYYKLWKHMRSVAHSVFRSGHYRYTGSLLTPMENQFYGFVKELANDENHPTNIIELRDLFFASVIKDA